VGFFVFGVIWVFFLAKYARSTPTWRVSARVFC
jgi:hypothetical protein